MNLEKFPSDEVAVELMEMVTGNGFYDHSYVGKWLFQVMGMEMHDARQLFDELQQQVFPETATWGLVYHEQKYGLVTDDNLLFDNRRQRILKKRNSRMSVNPETLKQLVENITGKTVEIEENISPYTFLIKVIISNSDNEINEPLFREQVKKIKQSHLAFQIMTERPLTANIYTGATMQQADIISIRQVI